MKPYHYIGLSLAVMVEQDLERKESVFTFQVGSRRAIGSFYCFQRHYDVSNELLAFEPVLF